MASFRTNCVSLLLAVAATAAAGSIFQWQCHGPYPGPYARVAGVPNPWEGAFAVQHGGGFFFGAEDLDGETLWQPRNDDLSNLNCTAVITTLSGGNVLVWAGSTSGLVRSDTWGSTWDPSGLGMKYVICLAAQPLSLTSEWILYVGSSDGTVFATADAGATWEDRTGNLPGSPVHSLAVDPNNPLTVFAGLYNGSIYKATIGSGDWTEVLPGDDTGRVAALVVHPRYPSKVFAGFVPTTTGGRTGFWRSTNSGNTWTKLTTPDQPIYALAIDPQKTEYLYAGSQGTADAPAVYLTTNDGQSWQDRDSGILDETHDLRVISLAIIPTYLSPPGILAGLEDGGICYSTDDGQHWRWQHRGLAIPGVPTVAPQPDEPNRVYAGPATGGCWGSLCGGWSWAQLDIGIPSDLPEQAAKALAVAPGGGYYPTVYLANDANELYRSDNGGTAWDLMLEHYVINDLEVPLQEPDTVYAAGYLHSMIGTSFFHSTDSGESWSAEGPYPNTGFALAVHPTNPQVIYLGCAYFGQGVGHTLFKSVNGGETWAAADTGINGVTVRSLAIHPTDPAILYAGLEEGGVYRTNNAAATWAPTGSALSTFTVLALAVDPIWPNTVMAGTQYYGVYRSTNSGGGWTNVSSGLSGGTVTQLAYHTDGSRRIFAATPNGGVFFRWFILDLNLDLVFDYLDVWDFKWYLIGAKIDLAAGHDSADVNNDGRVNVVDLVRMRLALD
ncbi:MAG TPA: hypothetical protein PLN26_15755 [Acidobacteriota bacterium]|nr:hypothetical protein [Acidobacteriota bacterium]HQG92966.1 hypothetical protein [Acidobacteriota bacterium]HQK87100.1 hypothetical protein [Acidobacteriota bacterium]